MKTLPNSTSSMKKIKNYALGAWVEPEGEGFIQHDAASGEALYRCSSEGLDYHAMAGYARHVGGPALRKMGFRQRGLMLKKLALALHDRRKTYYPLSYQTGATKSDSWIDIDGGIGTLFAYGSLRRKLPDQPFIVDGDMAPLSKKGTFIGRHILAPRHGVAFHINAFNFPIWGMLEKLSVSLLAGMPAIVKPSEVTSFLTQAMVEDMVATGILPEGALQLDCGLGHGILDPAIAQDVVTFTGSAETGRMLRSQPHLIEQAVPFNMEADSLNAAVLGPDAVPGSTDFNLFVREIRREMTVKCGQKCTAIRRVIVPENHVEAVYEALREALAGSKIGDPRDDQVRMGPLVSQNQRRELEAQLGKLRAENTVLLEGNGGLDHLEGKLRAGAFAAPVLFLNEDPFNRHAAHEVEAFGPVCTLMPYRKVEEAVELANLGKGSLVSTVATSDPAFASDYVMGSSAYHGRILILNERSADESTGHGSPMPLLVHGGPGRAGGGEELGGLRGMKPYLQRTALQGHPTMLTALTDQFQPGADYRESAIHPFRKHFEDLRIGDTVFTHKHTVTEADIVQFANVSGDHFYAHTDLTALEGTPFEGRVAHGYYILSKAAGLFVEPRKGPVILNYGIDNCRFTKPVYPGMTIGVRFTVQEKIAQEKREDEDFQKGIVKFLVDVYDETGETVALATILTMVKMRGDGSLETSPAANKTDGRVLEK